MVDDQYQGELLQVLYPLMKEYLLVSSAPGDEKGRTVPEATKIAGKSRQGRYSLEVKMDEDSNFYVYVVNADREVRNKLRSLGSLRENAKEDFLRILTKNLPTLEKAYVTYKRASDKKKAKGVFLRAVKKFKKSLDKDAGESLKRFDKEAQKVYKSLERLASKATQDVYKLLDAPYRAAVTLGKKPGVIILGTDDASYYLASMISGKILSDASAVGDVPLEKALNNKKLKDKKAIGGLLGAIGATAVAALYTYRRMAFIESLADKLTLEIQHDIQTIGALNDEISQYQSQLSNEYSGLVGRIRLLTELVMGQHEELMKRVTSLLNEVQPYLDIDHDGKIDSYIDANGDGKPDVVDSNGNIIGDGTGDNDLDNDGNPDVNPVTGDVIDDDAPINRFAGAALGQYLGADLSPEYQGYLKDYFVAIDKYQEAQRLLEIANTIGVDTDNDGKIDYLLKRDENGDWVPDTENGDWDLDNDGKIDIIVTKDDQGNYIWKINDQDAPFSQYASDSYDALVDVQNQLGSEIQTLQNHLMDILDQDHDGKIDDYRDLDGDGVADGDNDLDNDGNPDVNPVTGDVIDDDAPINRFAGAALGQYLGADLSPEYQGYLKDYFVALERKDMAQDLTVYNNDVVDPAVNETNTYVNEVNSHLSRINELNDAIEDDQQQIKDLQAEIHQLESDRQLHLDSVARYARYFTGLEYLAGALSMVTAAAAKIRGIPTLPYLMKEVGGVEFARAQ